MEISFKIVCLLLVGLCLSARATDIILYGTSARQNHNLQKDLYASSEGGSIIYMTGTGFAAKQDSIKLAFGVSGKFVTPELNSPLNYHDDSKLSFRTPTLQRLMNEFSDNSLKDFEIGLLESGTISRCSPEACLLKYRSSYTPRVVRTYPSTYCGQEIAFDLDSWDARKIDTGSANIFQKIMVSNGVCDTAPYFDPREDTYSYTTHTTFRCQIHGSSNPSADFHVYLKSGKAIQAYNYYDPIRTIYYKMQVFPTIYKLEPPEGSKGGGKIIDILGEGFTTNKEKVSVTVGSQPCQVISSTQTKITCKTQAPSTSPVRKAYMGLQRMIFNTTSFDVLGTYPNYENYELQEPILTTYSKSPVNSNQMEIIRGYFTPPTTTEYRFWMSGYKFVEAYFGTSPTNMSLVGKYGWVWGVDDYVYSDFMEYESTPWRNLTAGTKYYIELKRRMDGGFIRLALEQKHSSAHPLNVKQIQKVKMDSKPKYETHIFTVKNPPLDTSEYFKWKITQIDQNTGAEKTPITSGKINIRATLGEFKNGIKTAFKGINCNYELTFKDENGALLSISYARAKTDERVKEIIYKVKIVEPRYTSQSFISSGRPPKLILSSKSKLQSSNILHTSDYKFSQSLAGQFSLQTTFPKLGVIEMGPFGICSGYEKGDGEHIQHAIEDQLPQLKGKVKVWYEKSAYSRRCYHASNFFFEFSGFDEDLPLMTFGPSHQVTGGSVSGSQRDTVEIAKSSSTNILYPSIPPEYLSFGDSEHLVEVTSNGMKSVCKNFDCSLTFVDAPEITDFTYDTSTKQLTLSGTQFNLVDTDEVSFGEKLCQMPPTSKSTTQIVCTLADFPEAGNWTANVDSEKGLWVKKTSKIIEIPLIISSISPSTNLNPNGGTDITITGTGFPRKLATSNMEIKMNTNEKLKIKSTSFTSIVATVPAFTGSKTLIFTQNGYQLTDSNTIQSGTLTLPAISTFTPTYVSPVLNADITITITGSGISGLIASQFQVYLSKDGLDTEIGVKSYDSSAGTIVARSAGGNSGDYTVRVFIESQGFIVPTTPSSYPTLTIGSEIATIVPEIGSIMGGTQVIITGKGMPSATNNDEFYVYFGDVPCLVTAAANNQITCTTSKALKEKNLPTADQVEKVGVVTKFINRATCSSSNANGCVFNFALNETAEITGSSINAANKLEIVGTKLNLVSGDLSKISVNLDGISQTVESVTDTKIVVALTEINGPGLSTLSVKYDPYGYAYFKKTTSRRRLTETTVTDPEKINIPKKLLSITGTQGSEKGTGVIINGFGFGKKSTSYISIIAGSASICESVEYVSLSKVICHTKAQTISTASLMTLNYGGVTYSCPAGTSCTYSTSTTYNSLVSGFTATESNGDATITSTLSVASQCTAVRYKMGSLTSVCSSKTGTCTWNPTDLAIGTYTVYVQCQDTANTELYHILEKTTLQVTAQKLVTPSTLSSSFGGGMEYSFTGPTLGTQVENGKIKGYVCNTKVDLTKVNANQIKFQTPKLLTNYSVTNYNAKAPRLLQKGTFFGDKSGVEKLFDGDLYTQYISSASNCHVGIQLPHSTIMKSARIFIPELGKISFYICNATGGTTFDDFRQEVDLLVSETGTSGSWTKVGNIDHIRLHTGWNPFKLTTNSEIKGKYFKIEFEKVCQLGEIEIYGETIYESSASTQNCDLLLDYGTTTQTVSNAVNYDSSLTSVITGINTTLLLAAVGEKVALTGTNLPTGDLSGLTISLGGLTCSPISGESTSTSTVCSINSLSGISNSDNENSIYYFQTGKGQAVVQSGVSITVALKWSEKQTWGGFPIPVDGDTVHIPKGQTLIFDVEKGPILDLVLVEGRLIFPDATTSGTAKNIKFQARRLLVRQGILDIGSESAPYNYNHLDIILHGYEGEKQLPIFGNKFMGLYDGQMNIHGKKTNPTWTTLSRSAQKLDTEIYVSSSLSAGWDVGAEIVIAPSSNYHYFEVRKISQVTAISATESKITLDDKLSYEHIIEERSFNNVVEKFAVEVGLLTRNIKIQGNVESESNMFGGVFKIYGDSKAQISNVEFYRMGQAYNFGQYATSFVSIDCDQCYLKESAIHNSYFRAFSLDMAYQITIDKNVAADIWGDGFSVDNVLFVGETNNTFSNNLVIGTRKIWGFLEKGMVVGGGFFIPSPTNNLVNNVASGIQGPAFYWHTACYYENFNWPMGKFENNYAHTIGDYAYHLMFFMPRIYPLAKIGATTMSCGYTFSRKFRSRELFRADFNNFRVFNAKVGIGLFFVASANFTNTVISDVKSGIEYAMTDYVEVLDFRNTVIHSSKMKNKKTGVYTGWWADVQFHNITFEGYNDRPAFVACGNCLDSTKAYYWSSFEQVTWINSTNRTHWNYPEFVVDLDGTFIGGSQGVAGGVLTQYMPHLDKPGKCSNASASYEGGLYCKPEIKFRTMIVDKLDPPELLYYNLTIRREDTPPTDEELGAFLADNLVHSNYTRGHLGIPVEYSDNIFKVPIISGETFWVRWRHDIDFLKMRIIPWWRWEVGDQPTIVNFKHYEQRENFQIKKVAVEQLSKKCRNVASDSTSLDTNDTITQSSLQMGDHYYNSTSKELSLIVDRNPFNHAWVEVSCSKPSGNTTPPVEIENKTRLWSNASSWQNSQLPTEGSSPVIEETWNMVMDIIPPNLDTLTIYGHLTFQNNASSNLTLRAKTIKLYGGKLEIGNKAEPFKGVATIHIDSLPEELGSHNGIEGAMIVGGKLSVVGTKGRAKRDSRLKARIDMGDKYIKVDNSLDWTVNDIVLLAASGFGGESEKRTLVAYDSATGDATLNSPVEYTHLEHSEVFDVGGYNVVIQGNSKKQRGGRVRVEDVVFDDITYIGSGEIIDVLFKQMGHYHNEAMVVKANYFNGNNDPTKLFTVEDCGFVEIYGGAVEVISSDYVLVKNNIIYRPYMLGLHVERSNNTDVIGNVMMSVEDEEWKNYWLLKGLTFQGGFFICPLSTHDQCKNITFNHNMLIGSETIGVASQGLPCSKDTDYGNHTYYNTTIQSTTWIGWWISGIQPSIRKCTKLNNFYMLHNLNYSVFAENKTRTVDLYDYTIDTCFEGSGYGDGGINHTYSSHYYNAKYIAHHKYGSWLNVKKRPHLERSVGYEFENLAVEVKYNDPPNHFNMSDIDVRFFNATFENVKPLPYPVTKNRFASLWLSERFYTYSHEFSSPFTLFKGVTMKDVDTKHFIKWETDIQHLLSFEDVVYDGEFKLNNSAPLKPNFQVINNTPAIVDYLPNCYLQEAWNSYLCHHPDLAMVCLNTHLRLGKKVHFLRNDGFHSTDFARWQIIIDGTIRRVQWLQSLVETTPGNNSYVVKFESSLPPKISYHMEGQPASKGVHLQIHYKKPQSVRLWLNHAPMESNVFSSIESWKEPDKFTTCGDNVWRIGDNILELFITGGDKCLIRAEVIDALFVSLHIEVSIEDFFKSNGTMKFIDQVSSILGISPNRIRVVGIATGSTKLNAFIEKDEKTSSNDAVEELTELSQRLTEKKADLDLGGEILEMAVELAIAPIGEEPTATNNGDDDNDDEFSESTLESGDIEISANTDSEEKSGNTVIWVLLGLSCGFLIIVSALCCYNLWKKRLSKKTTSDIDMTQENLKRPGSPGSIISSEPYGKGLTISAPAPVIEEANNSCGMKNSTPLENTDDHLAPPDGYGRVPLESPNQSKHIIPTEEMKLNIVPANDQMIKDAKQEKDIQISSISQKE